MRWVDRFGTWLAPLMIPMLTLLIGLLLTALIVIALYAFGVFDTPYSDAFRFAFYLLLVLLVLSIWFGSVNHPNGGFDATVRAAK